MTNQRTLKSIIKARETREEQLLAEVGRLQRAVRAAEQRLQDGMAAVRAQDAVTPPTRLRSPWLGLAREYRRRLERDVFAAQGALATEAEAHEAARGRAVAASMERRAAEELLQRRMHEAREEARRQESKEMDALGRPRAP